MKKTNKFFFNPLKSVAILAVMFGLAGLIQSYSSSPPTGKTGAPGESTCASCHGGNNPNNLAGTISLTGLPSEITPAETYTISLSINLTAGQPERAGFELVVLNSENNNCGDLLATGTQTTTATNWLNRKYVKHNPAKFFGSNGASNNMVTYTFEWTAPLGATTATFYASAVLGYGGGTQGDKVILFQKAIPVVEQGGLACDNVAGYTKMGEVNGHGYYMSNDTKSWSLAKTLSENAGGYLATMNTQAENDFVKSHLQGNMVFIGYNDVQNEGTGAWANGEAVSLDLSYNNNATNDFAVMNFWAGTWQMEQPGPWRKYVMEKACGSGGTEAELSITNIQCPNTYPIRGSNYTVTFQVNNVGGTASVAQNAKFVQSMGFPSADTQTPGYTFEIPAIAAGDNVVLTKTFQINYSFLKGGARFAPEAGSYTILFGDFGFYLDNEPPSPNPQIDASFDYYCKKYNTDLAVSASANDLTYTAGGDVDYQVTVTNNGTETAYNFGVFVDEHFGGAGVSSGRAEILTAGTDVWHADNGVLWYVESLSPGASKTVDVRFSTFASGASDDITMSIFAGHNIDPVASNNDASLHITQGGNGGGSCDAISGYTKLGELNGHGYYMSNDMKPWSVAKILSESAGGYLVTMNTQAENDFIKNHLQNNMVFIGYNDLQSEGTGAWANGEAVSLNLSYNNNATNDFAVMNFWAGTWQMEQPGPWRKYVMEKACGGNPTNLPDLTVSNITNLPSSGEPLTQVNFNFNLNNIGNATASGSYNINMYLSTDATYSSNDVLVGNVPTGGTVVGTIADVPAAIAIPTIADGDYYLIIVADSDTDIIESNENNNTVSTPFTVGSGGGGNGACGALPGYTKLGTEDFNGHGYYMSNDTKPWNLAKTLSENAGGYLATMNTQAENDFVKSHLQSNMVFIGYNDVQNEGTGAWANGESVSLDLSYNNNPTNDFAVMNFWAGTWQMEQAGPWRKYILEKSCAMPIVVMPQTSAHQVMAIYPNPAINTLTASLKMDSEGAVSFAILNAQGQVQFVSMKYLSKGTVEVEFDIHTLETGMYFLNITGDAASQVIRFVKAN